MIGAAASQVEDVTQWWVLLASVIAATGAVIGVQVRLMAQQTKRLDRLEATVERIEAWRAPWANMPADMSDATLLTRAIDDLGHQLADISARLEHVEQTLAQWEAPEQ